MKQLNGFIKSELKSLRFRNRKVIRSVLVVAGKLQTRFLCELIIKQYGFSVTTISNVDELLDIITSNYVAILFDETDYNSRDLKIIEIIKVTSPGVKLLSFSANLKFNRRQNVFPSHKISSINRVVKGRSELLSEVSTTL